VTDIVIILNPTAGNLETVRDWQKRIESIVGRWPVRISSHAGEAETLARRAVEEGFGQVVAAGGDGTVNHVANGIAGSHAALGILPMGTINVFAMELGLPANDLEHCWEIVQAGNIRLVDLPSANGKYFVQLGGIGLDAQAVKETTLAF
jgi:diacylglycerol kinase family enzyme